MATKHRPILLELFIAFIITTDAVENVALHMVSHPIIYIGDVVI